jgi:transcriptional regulator with XRE-family HTH domain
VNLYERIEQLAEQKGLTICGLCKKAKVAASSIYEIRSGRKSGISRNTAEKLATALEITVDELYGKEKTPDAEAPRDKKYEEIINLLSALPEEKIAEAVRYLKFLADN